MPNLTITIPTYNRAHHLRDRLFELSTQITDNVNIIVFDNCSSDDTQKVANEFAVPYLQYYRSEVNMGMTRNFSRCFEQSQGSEWIWMLGDDDPIAQNAINSALELISNTTCDVINFASHCGHNNNMIVSSIEEFLKYKNVTDIMFISSLLFKRNSFLPYFSLLADASITDAPHVALILKMLCNKSGCLELRIEHLLQETPITDARWSTMRLAFGLTLLPKIITNNIRYQQKLAISIRNSTRWMLVFGVREIYDLSDGQEWKHACKIINMILDAYVASSWQALLADSQLLINLRKRFIYRTLTLMPRKWLVRIANNFRHRKNVSIPSDYCKNR